MTLHEFVEQNSGIRNVFDDMKHRIRTKDKIVDLEEWHKNLESYYNDYYLISGYLMAAYDYKRICFEERLALEHELNLVVTGREE